MPASKDIVMRYFVQEADNLWKCSCGKVLSQKKNTGFTNLFNHIKSQHPEYASSGSQPSISSCFALAPSSCKKGDNIYAWIRWICVGMKPFEFVEDPLTREFSRLQPISVTTLKKYMDLLTREVEKKKGLVLPAKFSLVVDGWTKKSTHFIGIFATYPAQNEVGYEYALLLFSPMVVETSFTAQQHMEHLEFVLQLYGKTMHENVIAIIGDNCETMKCLANLCSVPLVGCASHRFNLAVNKYMEYQDHMSVLNKINGLMGKLKNLKLAGKLRKYTELRPVQRNETRWSSTAAMVDRYLSLSPFISKPEIMSDQSIIDVIPTARENSQMIFLNQNLKRREYSENELSDNEKEAVILLKLPNSNLPTDTNSETSIDFAATILKKRKIEKAGSQYMNVKFILPTSNLVERFFSSATYSFSDLRQSLLPMNLEMQLFLKINQRFWNEQIVASIVA